jgi:predicted TIM-barrel fold metal-dependent hydrolase
MNNEILAAVINTLGFEKCLYGTDGPYAYATQGRMLKRINRLNISDNEREHILGGTFLKMIGF